MNTLCAECNDFPCDTGSPREVLERDPEFNGFDLSNLTPDWTSKQGFWGEEAERLECQRCASSLISSAICQRLTLNPSPCEHNG